MYCFSWDQSLPQFHEVPELKKEIVHAEFELNKDCYLNHVGFIVNSARSRRNVCITNYLSKKKLYLIDMYRVSPSSNHRIVVNRSQLSTMLQPLWHCDVYSLIICVGYVPCVANNDPHSFSNVKDTTANQERRNRKEGLSVSFFKQRKGLFEIRER